MQLNPCLYSKYLIILETMLYKLYFFSMMHHIALDIKCTWAYANT